MTILESMTATEAAIAVDEQHVAHNTADVIVVDQPILELRRVLEPGSGNGGGNPEIMPLIRVQGTRIRAGDFQTGHQRTSGGDVLPGQG